MMSVPLTILKIMNVKLKCHFREKQILNPTISHKRKLHLKNIVLITLVGRFTYSPSSQLKAEVINTVQLGCYIMVPVSVQFKGQKDGE